uniref:RNA polymerase subunit H/Rpb5 C-terminal domain-containing protein n=1 Tax=Oryza barthii TaxID=65489 RepID=A0A0D3HI30_9ORYZ
MSHSSPSQQSFTTIESAESATAATSIETAESTTAARDVSPPAAARDVSPPPAAARDVSPPSAAHDVQLVFCPPEPVKIATIREIYLQTKEENLSRLVLILQSKILSRAREAIKEIFKFKVDIFQATDLLVNITKHVLKPKHEVLSADQKAKLLKEYNVEDSQLPRMLETDAVARYYGFDKGTVVKVTYDGELTGKRVAYRCVF